MAKLVAAINMTLDGYCDHTAIVPDHEIHQHYCDLLNNADTILYGRITYQLMENHWPSLIDNPSGDKASDDFAVAIDTIQKIVFSHTLKTVSWKSSTLASKSLTQEVSALKQIPGRDILIGSRSLIIALLKANLVDELQLCIHPVLAGQGSPLFDPSIDRTMLKLTRTREFTSGAIILYYSPS